MAVSFHQKFTTTPKALLASSEQAHQNIEYINTVLKVNDITE